MESKQLMIQLKGNWARVDPVTDDERVLFERLYDCFEVIGELETESTEGRMIAKLKEQPNEIRMIFDRMLNNKNFLNDLGRLKTYSPIQNNTRKNRDVSMTDEKDFDIIIDVIYTVRNNLRHGKKEYTPRSEKIIRIVNRIFYKIVGGARTKYLSQLLFINKK